MKWKTYIEIEIKFLGEILSSIVKPMVRLILLYLRQRLGVHYVSKYIH